MQALSSLYPQNELGYNLDKLAGHRNPVTGSTNRGLVFNPLNITIAIMNKMNELNEEIGE